MTRGLLQSSLFVSFGDIAISVRSCLLFSPSMSLRLFFHTDNKLARPEILVKTQPTGRAPSVRTGSAMVRPKQRLRARGVETLPFYD